MDISFPHELRKENTEKFVNLKQGKISVKEYALEFHQLSRYALELVSNIRERMRKLTFGLSHNLIFEIKTAFLFKDMDISRLVVHTQQMEDVKRK